MNGSEYRDEAERILNHAEECAEAHSEQWYANAMAAAQVNATLAQVAATERLAIAVENLPTYEGMLSVYAFGVNGR